MGPGDQQWQTARHPTSTGSRPDGPLDPKQTRGLLYAPYSPRWLSSGPRSSESEVWSSYTLTEVGQSQTCPDDPQVIPGIPDALYGLLERSMAET